MLQNRIDPVLTQRIILFIGSPIESDDDLLRVLELLKTNGIALDVVSFGEVADNAPLIETFPALLDDGVLVVTVPPGPHILVDMIAKTDVIMRDGGMVSYDPQFDPEYAEAIQASLRDYEAANNGQAYDEEEEIRRAIMLSLQDSYPPAPAPQPPAQQPLHIDPELEMAVQMSLQQQAGQPQPPAPAPMEEDRPQGAAPPDGQAPGKKDN